MPRKLLDTSILIRQLVATGPRRAGEHQGIGRPTVGQELVGIHRTSAIVTPVYFEMVCGVTTSHELKLTRAFLSVFTIIDGGSIHDDDWVEARRIAERVVEQPGRMTRQAGRRPTPRRRQLGECLIRAIARRLNYDVIRSEQHFPV